MNTALRKENITKIINCFPFILAFGLMVRLLYNTKTMCDVSGDAAEMWKVISSYGLGEIYGSYVLYKGLITVYPWVWLRNGAVFFGLNEWLFVKLFYVLCFSYISAIGLPKIIEKITCDESKWWKNMILVIACYYFWVDVGVLNQLVIDLPCMTFFVLLVNMALDYNKERKGIVFSAVLGLLIGLNLSASGQYTLPCLFVLVFLLIIFVQRIGERSNIKKDFVCLGTTTMLASIIKYSNVYFLKHVVGNLREDGAWIPSAADWLSIGFTRFDKMLRQLTGINGIDIISNRNGALLEKLVGNEYYISNYEHIISGGYPITTLDYFKWIMKYPLDFLSLYVDKFILGMTMDGGRLAFVPVFISYTMFFLSLALIYKKCKAIKDIFNRKIWVIFAFVGAVIPSIALVIESRVWIQLQGLVMAAAICSNCFWEGIQSVYNNLKTMNKNCFEKKINYTILIYIIFMLMAIAHIASLYSASIEGTEVLWKFF